jgi:hypothetical protein
MVTGLKSWLEGAFDYAGLFPPAQLGMEEALREFVDLQDQPAGFLVDRFLVPAGRFAEMASLLDEAGIQSGFPVSVIGSAYTPGSLDLDWKACSDPRVEVTGYELKCPPGPISPGLLKEVKKSAMADALGDDFFLEFAWDEHQEDNLAEAAGTLEEIGFKARTGGLTANDFPTVEQLAVWIVSTASLDAPVKFTAGLHEAVRFHDDRLHVMRHGFLNVLTAFVLARAEDLVVDEVTAVLAETHHGAFNLGRAHLGFGGHEVPWEAVEDTMDWYRGIGSCSITEPYDALRRLNLI